MAVSTTDLHCPFRLDAASGDPVTCEGATCAAWNNNAGECVLLQGALSCISNSLDTRGSSSHALPTRTSAGMDT